MLLADRCIRILCCGCVLLFGAHAQPYTISTFAGSPSLPNSGPAVAASLVAPDGLASDSLGNFYFTSLGRIGWFAFDVLWQRLDDCGIELRQANVAHHDRTNPCLDCGAKRDQFDTVEPSAIDIYLGQATV